MPNEFIARNGLIALNNTTITGSLSIGGTQTATGSIARTMLISSSLSASANNDTLVGLDVDASFTTGSLTGVQNYSVRVNGGVGFINTTVPNQAYTIRNTSTDVNTLKLDIIPTTTSTNYQQTVSIKGQNARLTVENTNDPLICSFVPTYSKFQFQANNNYVFFVAPNGAVASIVPTTAPFNTPRNYLDDGSGNSIITGSLRVLGGITGSIFSTGSSSQTLLRIESPGSSSIVFVSGSGNVGIGTNTPASTLTINGNTRLVTPTQGGFFAYDAPTAGSFIWSLTRFTSVNSNDLNISVLNGFAVRTGTSTPANTGHQFYINTSGNVGIGTTSPTARIHTVGAGTTSATTNFLLQNSTPSTLLTILDNGQYTYSGPLLTLTASQSAYVISQSISSSNTVGGQVYGVNITPTFWQTTASQTETAFRVAATFNTSSILATAGTNIIADFGASSVGSQLTVTDVTSGSIYMVNDVSGLPIIEATSDWTVNMYNFPNLVFQKTGSQVNINGTLRVSGSFILPLSQSVSPQTGSAYWSGSFLFVWDGLRYRSSSFA